MLGHHHPRPSVNLTMHCNPGGHILRDTQLNVSDQMDRNATQQRCGEARGGVVGDWCTIQCSGQPPVDTLVKGVRTDGRSLTIIIIIISEVTHIQYVGNPTPIVVGWSVGSFPRRPLLSKWMFTFQSFCCSTYCTNIRRASAKVVLYKAKTDDAHTLIGARHRQSRSSRSSSNSQLTNSFEAAWRGTEQLCWFELSFYYYYCTGSFSLPPRFTQATIHPR